MQPEDVQRCLSGDVDDDVVRTLLAELRGDAQWIVFAPITVPPKAIVQMVYLPTGMLYGFAAYRGEGGTWRFEH
jgi:hypothetical protein